MATTPTTTSVYSIRDYSYNVEKANAYLHTNLVRPPHGWMRLSQYAWLSRKFKIVMWDVVTRDYSKWMSAANVLYNVKHYTRNGSIITFHDSLKSIDKLKTALPQAIEWLQQQGYQFKISRPTAPVAHCSDGDRTWHIRQYKICRPHLA